MNTKTVFKGKGIKKAKSKSKPVSLSKRRASSKIAFKKTDIAMAAGGLVAASVAGYLLWRNRDAIKSTLSDLGERIPKIFSGESKGIFGSSHTPTYSSDRTTNPDAYL